MMRISCWAAVAVLLASSLLAAPRPNVGILVPKEMEAVDRITQAYQRGDPGTAFTLLSPLVVKLTPAKFDEVEQILKSRNLPAVAQILAEARLALVQQGLEDQLPKVLPREAALVLPLLAARVDEVLKLRDENPSMAQNPLTAPSTISEFEQALWDLHVLENRLENATRLAEYTRQLAKGVSRAQRSKLPADDQRLLAADYQAPIDALARALTDLGEREIQLRIWRLQLAKKLLAEKELTKEKFLAAYAAQLDARLVREFLQAHRGLAMAREELNAPDLMKQIDADAAEASRLAGELQVKAQMLFEGMHWWLRGRYGIGPDVFGLAKSPAALKSLDAQFGIYMPAAFPKPTDPLALESGHGAAPRFDRRHHYWWGWEDRKVIREAIAYSERTTTTEVEGEVRREELTTTQFF